MENPSCCGKPMKLLSEYIKYTEYKCEKCGDILRIKKTDVSKPVMLDD